MTLRPLREDEAPEAARRSEVSMGRPADEPTVERWRKRIQRGEVWGLERDGRVVGQCVLLPTDHWLGGSPVRCLDVSGVAVPPEHRGQGAARAMMEAAAEKGAAEEYGLSLLFPATTAMYRKLGWEHAGTWQRYRVAPRAAPADGPPMRLADGDADWQAIRDCFDEDARTHQGPAVRSGEQWAGLAEAPLRYVLDEPGSTGRVEAYALIRQRRVEGNWQHVVVLDDWAATTERGLRAVIGTVGRWSTFGSAAELTDTVPSRWSAVLPEQDLEHAGGMHWMARAFHLPAAISARGFPRGLSVSVSLRLDGGPGPQGPWRLEIADGRGALSPAETADVRLRERAAGPLLTGFWSARQLRRLGLLDGPDDAVDLLDAAFAGPPPVLLDMF